MGSYPTLRPERCFAKPISQSALQAADFGSDNGAPLSNRAIDGLLSDGLDVQADHRAGRARQPGVITPGHADQRRRAASTIGAHAARSATPARPPTAPSRCASALQVSSDVFFYTLGARPERAAAASRSRAGRASSASAAAPASTCPARSRADPDRAWRARDRRDRGARASKRTQHPLRHLRQAPVDASATTSTSPSARATCRPRRCRWRSPTRRSRTAAGSRARTSACAVEDDGGRLAAEIEPRPGAPRRRSTRATARRSWTACTRPRTSRAARRPTCSSGWTAASRSPARPAPPSATASGDQSWYVAYVAGRRPRPIVVAVTVERGGFGAEAAAPAARLILAQWFGVKKKLVARELARPDEHGLGSPIQRPDRARRRVRAPLRADLPARPVAAAGGARPRAPARS